MINRVSFVLIAAFWVVMNVLLWRSEYGANRAGGSTVPAATVWNKMLTAPDSSSLVILRHGKSVGFCRWATEDLAAPAGKTGADELSSQDMVRESAGYRINFDGSAALAEFTNRLHFDFGVTLDPGQNWREVSLRLGLRHNTCLIQSAAADRTLQVKMSGDDGDYDRVFKFSDLQNPAALLEDFDLPPALTLLAGPYLPATSATNAPPQLGVTWVAREDWLKLGHTPTRIYRLQTRLLDRFDFVILVSRAGEILRAELPGDVVLVNDRLNGM